MTDRVAQHLFKEEVQKLGIFHLKAAGAGAQTIFMFVDSILGSQTLHDQLQVNFSVSYISYETFRDADVTVPEYIDRFSSEIEFYVTLKESSRGNKFKLATVDELAKTAAARFGMIMHMKLVDDREFATKWRLKYKIDYNSVADANDAVHVTNPANGLVLPYGHAEVSIHG